MNATSRVALVVTAVTAALVSGGSGIALAITCALAVAMAGLCAARPAPPAKLGGDPYSLFWILLFGHFALMLLPIPASMAALAPGARGEHIRNALSFVENMKPGSGTWSFFRLSLNAYGSMRLFLSFALSFAAFTLIRRLPRNERDAIALPLLVFGACLAALGLVSRYALSQGDSLLWFIPIPPQQPGPLVCFRNRNHFGGFLALLIPLALYTAEATARKRRWILAAGGALPGAALMACGVVASGSRGALLAALAGIAVMGACRIPRRLRLPAGILALAAAVGLGTLIFNHRAAIRESFRGDRLESSVAIRIEAAIDSIRAFGRYPILGAGPNAFRAVFGAHRRTGSHSAFQAHPNNGLVELLVDAGIAGLILLGVFLFLVWRDLRRLAPPRRAALAGLVAVAGVHALMDFCFHTPLYLFAFFAALATLTPVTLPRLRRHPLLSAPALRTLGAGTALASLAMLPFYRSLQDFDSPRRIAALDKSALRSALTSTPSFGLVWYAIGRAEWKSSGAPTERALAAFERAAALDGQNYRLLGNIAIAFHRANRREQAWRYYEQARLLRDWYSLPELESARGGKP